MNKIHKYSCSKTSIKDVLEQEYLYIIHFLSNDLLKNTEREKSYIIKSLQLFYAFICSEMLNYEMTWRLIMEGISRTFHFFSIVFLGFIDLF